MLTLPAAVRIHLCIRPVDMRKSFTGLSLQVRQVLQRNCSLDPVVTR